MSLNSRDALSPLALAETGVSASGGTGIPVRCVLSDWHRFTDVPLCIIYMFRPVILLGFPVLQRASGPTRLYHRRWRGCASPYTTEGSASCQTSRQKFKVSDVLPGQCKPASGIRKYDLPQDFWLLMELLISCWASSSNERTAALAASGLPAQIAS